MNLSTLLTDARASHRSVIAVLKKVYDALDEDTKAERYDGSFARMVVPFDLMAQFDMVKLLVKGRVKEDSLIFLKGMHSFHFELFDYLKKYADVHRIEWDIDYDNFLGLDDSGVERFLAVAKASIAPLWEETLRTTAKADFVSENLFPKLEEGFFGLIASFLMVDETVDETELRRGIETIREDILLPIVASNEDLKKQIEGE